MSPPPAPHANDRAIRALLADLGASFLRHLLHLPVASVKLVETQLPKVIERRADLVLEVTTGDGETPILHHIEAQRQNEAHLPARMMTTAGLLVDRHPERRIDQTVIYFGEEPCRIRSEIALVQCRYRFRLIDMRAIDCRQLLEAPEPEAAVLAVLCQATDRTPEELVHAIVARLFAESSGAYRTQLLFQLETLAVNRRLEGVVKEEVNMFSLEEIRNLPSYREGLLAPACRRAGRKAGGPAGWLIKGEQEGRHRGSDGA